MNDKTIWMVRSGRDSAYASDCLDGNFVGIGFAEAGDVAAPVDKDTLKEQIVAANPQYSMGKVDNVASQLKRFFDDLRIGDSVMTYDSSRRMYYFGQIKSDVLNRSHALGRQREVLWTNQIARDSLTQATRNSLGSTMSLFLVQDAPAAEVLSKLSPLGSDEGSEFPNSATSDADTELTDTIGDREEEADQLIDDKLASLTWEEMQELVAELLRSLGFRAEVSAKGGDQGVDIFASPDGLGLHEPRIFVEVKHRPGSKIGADQVRAFLGGRHPGDRCLYVSTGGFSKEAVYEAARSSRPCTLIDLPKLRTQIKENYSRFTPEGMALLPLRRIYLPAT